MKYLNALLFSSVFISCTAYSNSQIPTPSTSSPNKLYHETYRPQVHFSPAKKWMNDPNGMFYLNGEYHLFYQHNPLTSVWGPMNWGHAVSKDLVHWKHLPIALKPDLQGMIFSGSAVVDTKNTSGLGTKDNPPIVALYTNHDQSRERQGHNDFQTQALAYSLDKGLTWTKYAHNPVLKNPGIRDFRDPKVMWHEASNRWVMALAQKDRVGFYSSSNLKEWKLESTFGRDTGSHGGVWECPELMSIKVDGSNTRKYVLLVSVGSGGPNGGSATQYFVGDFDGHQFTLDPAWQKELAVTQASFPQGKTFNDFEHDVSGWKAKGKAFAGMPTRGGHIDQPPPRAFQGNYLINSFADKDRATGTLESPKFTIEKPYINFLIGGFPGWSAQDIGLRGKSIWCNQRSATGCPGGGFAALIGQ